MQNFNHASLHGCVQISGQIIQISTLSLSKGAAPASNLSKPASFDRLRMLVSDLSSDFALALGFFESNQGTQFGHEVVESLHIAFQIIPSQ